MFKPPHRFESGNTFGKGRPRGSRNKLDAFAYACVLAHVQHNLCDPPPEEYAHSNLWKALTLTLKESPRDYVARVISMLPKEWHFENTKVTELDDEELDRMILMLRERAREERAMIEVTEPKMISHAH
jgi:hypothetical protein